MKQMVAAVILMAATSVSASAAGGPAYLAGAQDCSKLAVAYSATWKALDAGKSEKDAEAAAVKASGLDQSSALSASSLAEMDRRNGAALAEALEHYRKQCTGSN